METWLAVLSQPITQLGGIFGIFIALHKAGVLDVRTLIRSAIGIDAGVEQVNGDTRNTMQILLSKMEELAQYANHDTTEALKGIKEDVQNVQGKMDQHIREHDKAIYILEDIKNNGVKCRGN